MPKCSILQSQGIGTIRANVTHQFPYFTLDTEWQNVFSYIIATPSKLNFLLLLSTDACGRGCNSALTEMYSAVLGIAC